MKSNEIDRKLLESNLSQLQIHFNIQPKTQKNYRSIQIFMRKKKAHTSLVCLSFILMNARQCGYSIRYYVKIMCVCRRKV